VSDLRVERLSVGFRQRWRILLSVAREKRVELPIYLNGSGWAVFRPIDETKTRVALVKLQELKPSAAPASPDSTSF
jgi:hypothetical protein